MLFAGEFLTANPEKTDFSVFLEVVSLGIPLNFFFFFVVFGSTVSPVPGKE